MCKARETSYVYLSLIRKGLWRIRLWHHVWETASASTEDVEVGCTSMLVRAVGPWRGAEATNAHHQIH